MLDTALNWKDISGTMDELKGDPQMEPKNAHKFGCKWHCFSEDQKPTGFFKCSNGECDPQSQRSIEACLPEDREEFSLVFQPYSNVTSHKTTWALEQSDHRLGLWSLKHHFAV